MRFTHLTVLALLAPVAVSFVVPSSFRSSNLVEKKRYPMIPSASSRHQQASVLYMVDDRNEPPLRGRDRRRRQLEEEIADAETRRDELQREIKNAETEVVSKRQALENEIAKSEADVARKQKALENFEQEVERKKEKLENVDKQTPLDLAQAATPFAVTSLAALGVGRAAVAQRERQLEEEARQEQIRAREAGTGSNNAAVGLLATVSEYDDASYDCF